MQNSSGWEDEIGILEATVWSHCFESSQREHCVVTAIAVLQVTETPSPALCVGGKALVVALLQSHKSMGDSKASTEHNTHIHGHGESTTIISSQDELNVLYALFYS